MKDRETVGVKPDQICLKYLSRGFVRVDHSKGFSLRCYVNFSPQLWSQRLVTDGWLNNTMQDLSSLLCV